MDRRLLTVTSVLAAFVASASCASLLGDFNAPGAAADGGAQNDSATVDVMSDTGATTHDGTADAPESMNAKDATDGTDATDSTGAADGAACPAGQVSCGGSCTDTSSNVHSCGACGHDCNALPHVTGVGVTCAGSRCNVPATSCFAGYAHCSTVPDDGCEADVTKPARCGDCITMCPSAAPVCAGNVNGAVTTYSCATGCSAMNPTLCTGTCTNLMTDPKNCGTCGTACSGQCLNSVCWTPTSLSALALWLDASVGVTQSSGNVSAWADGSKDHNNAVQYTTANTPTVGAFGTRQAVYFDDRNSSEMRIADSNTLQWSTGDFLIELVVQYNHYPLARDLLIGKTLSASPFTGPAIFVNDPPDGSGKIRAYLDASNYVTSAVGGYNGSVAHIIGMHRAGTGVELRIDGASSSTATLASIDVSAAGQLMYMGGHYPGGAYGDGYFGGIAEIIAAGAPISGMDVTNVETYLKIKYGL